MIDFIKKNYFVLVVIVVGVAIDQATKRWMVTMLPSFGEMQSLTSFFNLVMVKNEGMGFGFLQNSGVPQVAVVFFTALVALLALAVFWQGGSQRLKFALSLAIAGGVSNGIDRMVHGGVIDFLDFHWRSYHWPAFNVADIMISVAILLLSLEIIFGDGQGDNIKKRKKRRNK